MSEIIPNVQKHLVKVEFDPVLPDMHWMSKSIMATRGNQTVTGMIVLAMLGKVSENPPRIVGSAEISPDGFVLAPFQDRGMTDCEIVAVCRAQELIDQFRRLADHLKLTEGEREAMFFELRAWVAKDHRAEPSYLG